MVARTITQLPAQSRRGDFDGAFNELLAARNRYENLRIAGTDFDQLAHARTRLIHLRAQMARIRNEFV